MPLSLALSLSLRRRMLSSRSEMIDSLFIPMHLVWVDKIFHVQWIGFGSHWKKKRRKLYNKNNNKKNTNRFDRLSIKHKTIFPWCWCARMHTHSNTQKRQQWIEENVSKDARYYAKREHQTNAPMNNRCVCVCVYDSLQCVRAKYALEMHLAATVAAHATDCFLLLLFVLPFIFHEKNEKKTKNKTNTNTFFSIRTTVRIVFGCTDRWWWILCIFLSLLQYNQLVAFTTTVFHIYSPSLLHTPRKMHCVVSHRPCMFLRWVCSVSMTEKVHQTIIRSRILECDQRKSEQNEEAEQKYTSVYDHREHWTQWAYSCTTCTNTHTHTASISSNRRIKKNARNTDFLFCVVVSVKMDVFCSTIFCVCVWVCVCPESGVPLHVWIIIIIQYRKCVYARCQCSNIMIASKILRCVSHIYVAAAFTDTADTRWALPL